MMKYSVTSFQPSQFLDTSGKLGVEYTPYALLTLFIGCVIWFIVSVLKEKGINMGRSSENANSFGVSNVYFFCLSVFRCLVQCQ